MANKRTDFERGDDLRDTTPDLGTGDRAEQVRGTTGDEADDFDESDEEEMDEDDEKDEGTL